MKKALIKKTIEIEAPKEAVWDALTDPEHIKAWSSEFMPGSFMEGTIGEGEEVVFKDPEHNGIKGKVTKCDPQSKLKIEYHTSLSRGVPNEEDSKEWKGSYDLYVLKDLGGKTRFTLETGIPERYSETFKPLLDKSLDKIKELAEA